MAIEWPVGLIPTRMTWRLESAALLNVSPISFATQSVSRGVARWTAVLGFDPIMDDRRARLSGLIAALDGPAKEVRFWRFDRPTPRGSAAPWPGGDLVTTWAEGTTWDEGTTWEVITPPIGPQLATAAPSGTETVDTWGWRTNDAVLLVGDCIGIGGSLYMVTADATTDGTGRAVLHIAPRLRAASTIGTPIVTTRPTARFRLVDGQQAAEDVRPGGIGAVSVTFIESLP